jgi:hypothetical protein
MLPLNHKNTTSSLVPPTFYVAKNCQLKQKKLPHFQSSDFIRIIGSVITLCVTRARRMVAIWPFWNGLLDIK